MSQKLLTLYRSILSTANLVADGDGFISASYGDTKKPVVIKGKSLVLPTPEQLKNPDWSARIAFHPMFENILHDESDVLEKFRTSLNTRVNVTIGVLGYDMLRLATSIGEHAKLSPDQSEFLSRVKNAYEKTLEVYKKLLTKMPQNQVQRQSVSIYLKRGGMLDGVKHARVGVVNFPLYHALAEASDKGYDEVYDVKLRKKDIATLMGLFEYIFPSIGTQHFYSRASDSKQAPFLDALMKALLAIAGPINDVVTMFIKQLGDPEKLLFDADWVEAFENIDALMHEARSIPMLSASAAQPTNVAAQPVAAAAKASDVPIWMQPAQPQPYGGFAPGGQPMTAAPTIVRTPRGTVDFDSIIRATPALANQGGFSGSFGQPAYNRDTSPPRWAPQGGGGFGGGWGGAPAQSGWSQPQTTWGQQPGFSRPSF